MTLIRRLSFIFLFLVLPALGAQSSLPQSQEAKSLYDSGKYEEAFQTLVSHPADDWAYYYNLGTTAAKLNRLGLAVAYLEKANRIGPHEPEVQKNLNIAKDGLARLLGPEKLDPASSWLESVSDRVSIDEVRGIFGLVALVLALVWTRSYLKSRSLKKTFLRTGGIVSVLALALTYGLYCAQRSANDPAAVIERQIVRSGPGERFIEIGQIETGIKVRLLDTPAHDHWRQIRFSPDAIGWVKDSSLLLL